MISVFGASTFALGGVVRAFWRAFCQLPAVFWGGLFDPGFFYCFFWLFSAACLFFGDFVLGRRPRIFGGIRVWTVAGPVGSFGLFRLREGGHIFTVEEKLELHMTVHKCEIFMHDGAQCHRSRSVTTFLKSGGEGRGSRLAWWRSGLGSCWGSVDGGW